MKKFETMTEIVWPAALDIFIEEFSQVEEFTSGSQGSEFEGKGVGP